jgi:multiple sugar transport system permease protein
MRKRLRARTKRILLAWILVSPAVIFRVFATLYPSVWTFFYSFFNYNQIGRIRRFIGFDNYIKIFRDQAILDSLVFSVFFVVVSVSMQIVLGVLIAALMNQKFFGRKFVRVVNLIPWAISMPIAGFSAYWIFNADYGLVNDILYRIAGIKPLWFVNSGLARMSVVMADVWKNTPFLSLMILAAMQGIDLQQYESASMDGAGVFRKFFSITLPSILPTIVTLGIFITIWRVTSFELVYAMTQGGPGTVTSLLSYQIYRQAIVNFNFGYSSTISMVLFVVVGLMGVCGLALQRKIAESR